MLLLALALLGRQVDPRALPQPHFLSAGTGLGKRDRK
jgi:hypothetical protein